MKSRMLKQFAVYVYNNYVGNFLGFVIGMVSARLVSHYFTTRSIRNLWGHATHKTVVDKHTYSTLEWTISIIIGFIVFEIVSKWLKKKMHKMLPKYKLTRWLVNSGEENPVTGEAQ